MNNLDEFKCIKTYESRISNPQNLLDGYLDRLLARKPTKAQNYMQETAEPYLKHIQWQNQTLEADLRLFWISASRYYRSHTHAEFVKLLDWVKGKNLYPKQVIKVFNKRSVNLTH